MTVLWSARKHKYEKMLGVIRIGSEGGGYGKRGRQVLGFYSSFYWLLEKLWCWWFIYYPVFL